MFLLLVTVVVVVVYVFVRVHACTDVDDLLSVGVSLCEPPLGSCICIFLVHSSYTLIPPHQFAGHACRDSREYRLRWGDVAAHVD